MGERREVGRGRKGVGARQDERYRGALIKIHVEVRRLKER